MDQVNDKSPMPVVIIAAVLLVINISLIVQNLNLRSELTVIRPAQIEEGEIIADFRAQDLSGNQKKIDCVGKQCRRVLLFFKTTCAYCEQQMLFWKILVSSIDDQDFKVTAITTETDTQAIEDYIKKHQVEDWEVLMIKPEDAQTAKLPVTPITFVLNGSGAVEKVWVGLWQARDVDSASSYFSLDFRSSLSPR